MTTLVAWVSFQNQKPTALNFASDSRFTWGKSSSRWDGGRKLFWCKHHAEMFGYAGDVATQSSLLSQLCEALDYSNLVLDDRSAVNSHGIFLELFKSAVSAQVNIIHSNMTVLHGSRTEDGTFSLWCTEYVAKNSEWRDAKIEIYSHESTFTKAVGTGAGKFNNRFYANKQKYGPYSRTVFSSLLEAIGPTGDPSSGGIPQVVTLGSMGLPKPVGISIGGVQSLAGMKLGSAGKGGNIEWRNEKFEFIDGDNLLKRTNAKQHIFW